MYRFIRPLLFKLDAESAHRVSFGLAGVADRFTPWLVRGLFDSEYPSLQQTVWGLQFRNPVGLAAGADKNAEFVRFWELIGMGYVEIGSVTARGGVGNPKPRSFRLPQEGALINRMGLNNHGAARIADRIRDLKPGWKLPLGVNLAKTHDPGILGSNGVADFVTSFRLVAPLADYVALNISCPNTAEGKTFEDPGALDQLLKAIMAERSALQLDVPVLVKWSPPAPGDNLAGAFDELIDRCVAHGVDGHIATNTASDRAGLKTAKSRLAQIGAGGLSGLPLADRAHKLVRWLFKRVGRTAPIIGVGGIHSAEEAYRRIRSGASLIQVYTGLVYEGPGLVKRINCHLAHCLERDGIESIDQVVGLDVD